MHKSAVMVNDVNHHYNVLKGDLIYVTQKNTIESCNFVLMMVHYIRLREIDHVLFRFNLCQPRFHK